ncbi:glycerophosphodiester phosphodiesterase [Bacillus sp. RG28]|uniref:Glycerophosphodiester phosphodiesterase n=1 Tax=Gottfriedia endophytica TaxID=2820819 RepID=A0A940NHY7_9BACI|nr:glycerophosphodiester phosphodiesterase [Gottfriedia endophytica]MBP0724392.1 glycerophosphodiester phosphodiesterase [Gottfriedia endophytica]
MVQIFGHRGAAGTFPENTMVSFKACEKFRTDGIELDVQLTSDGEIVVIHDETINRTSNGKGYVKDFTLSQLKQFDFSNNFKEKVGFCEIPTLKEVFDWAQNNDFYINIELKNDKIPYHGLEERVINLIRQYEIEERIIISSFNHKSMFKLHLMAPDIETGVLYYRKKNEPWKLAEEFKTKAVHPNYKSITDEQIIETLNHHIAVRPYTVNDPFIMKRLIALNCTAIITDYPEIAAELVGK